MSLPSRNLQDEKAFLSQAADLDLDSLLELIQHALDEKRPQLAGRLACLVDYDVVCESGSALEKARVASQLWLVKIEQPDPEPEPTTDYRRPTRRRSRRAESRYRRILKSPNRRPGSRR